MFNPALTKDNPEEASIEPLRAGGLDQSIQLEVFGKLDEFGEMGKTVT